MPSNQFCLHVLGATLLPDRPDWLECVTQAQNTLDVLLESNRTRRALLGSTPEDPTYVSIVYSDGVPRVRNVDHRVPAARLYPLLYDGPMLYYGSVTLHTRVGRNQFYGDIAGFDNAVVYALGEHIADADMGVRHYASWVALSGIFYLHTVGDSIFSLPEGVVVGSPIVLPAATVAPPAMPKACLLELEEIYAELCTADLDRHAKARDRLYKVMKNRDRDDFSTWAVTTL